MSSCHSFSKISNVVDITEKRIFLATIHCINGIISAIEEMGGENPDYHYLIPGFIDAHVHIESSMLIPSEFARIAVRHGTVATVSDPHEIANVLGLKGVHFMIENAAKTPFKIFFGAPSCVPATSFETAGANLNAKDLEPLFATSDVTYLSEMMNYPGVLGEDADVIGKIKLAQRYNRPIDGHAPGVFGEDALRYAKAGISTDHECSTLEEAENKLQAGMLILIREGSAARNFEALHSLISRYPDKVMLCSDDKHPDELKTGHINILAKRALAKGHSIFDILQCACVNPVRHYGLNVGLLAVGDSFDAVEVDNLSDLIPLCTWIAGELVAENGRSLLPKLEIKALNVFQARQVLESDFKIAATDSRKIRVIKAIDGELFTEELLFDAKVEQGLLVADTDRDILWLAVINRYQPQKPAIAFIQGFGLKQGALASSVAHDSHNVIAVGADLESLCAAINCIIQNQGGIACAQKQTIDFLALPIAGLMSDADGDSVAAEYSKLDTKAKQLGSPLHAPFMTLSFMALLVIPELKLSDKGLFDGRTFQFTEITLK